MNDIAAELAVLHQLSGAEFSRHIEYIANMRVFHILDNETNIFTTGGESSQDFPNQLKAARKLVALGYKVFLLPNPKGGRTPDMIIERKGVYRIYDLKTITGESSAINRLRESIGQCNQVIMNMATNYDSRQLGKDIRQYFVLNPNAVEVMIFKGGRQIIVKRGYALSTDFVKVFMMRYNKRKSR
jgi:hypothetical protein